MQMVEGTLSRVGHYAAMGGLILQLLSFSTFMVLLAVFGLRVLVQSSASPAPARHLLTLHIPILQPQDVPRTLVSVQRQVLLVAS